MIEVNKIPNPFWNAVWGREVLWLKTWVEDGRTLLKRRAQHMVTPRPPLGRLPGKHICLYARPTMCTSNLWFIQQHPLGKDSPPLCLLVKVRAFLKALRWDLPWPYDHIMHPVLKRIPLSDSCYKPTVGYCWKWKSEFYYLVSHKQGTSAGMLWAASEWNLRVKSDRLEKTVRFFYSFHGMACDSVVK